MSGSDCGNVFFWSKVGILVYIFLVLKNFRIIERNRRIFIVPFGKTNRRKATVKLRQNPLLRFLFMIRSFLQVYLSKYLSLLFYLSKCLSTCDKHTVRTSFCSSVWFPRSVGRAASGVHVHFPLVPLLCATDNQILNKKV